MLDVAGGGAVFEGSTPIRAVANARETILASADYIEKFPQLYQFNGLMPEHAWSPGGALGWIGFFSGQEIPERNPELVTLRVLDCAYPSEFHHRMREINGEFRWDGLLYWLFRWLLHWDDTPRRVVRSLRRYADLYHPAIRTAKGLETHAGL